ncbi:MAG: oligopeptide/dipeptide ABC transporter ATP-binding protein, partial [Candidatus Methylomirabilota bacterium]
SAGRILYQGRDLRVLTSTETRQAALKVQMIFQDPSASLNPRMRMGEIVGEAPLFHRIVPRAELDGYVDGILRQVGLDPDMKGRYPHQFSGGQRQRIGIARALAVKPDFIVCDEAVAALDVSIQAQIINLFMDLREAFQLTYLFITHDIGVVRHVASRVVVMYLGRVVEMGRTEAILDAPRHPYTQILLQQVPRLSQRRTRFTPIEGEIPSPLNPPLGCYFHPRCPFASARCREVAPSLRETSSGRYSACHLHDG